MVVPRGTRASRGLLWLLLACFAAGLVPAQAPQACDGTSSAAMRACADQRLTQASSDMDAAYTRLARQCSPAQRRSLALSQAAWLRFRNANAAFEAQAAGDGTLAPLLRITTLASMTALRAQELNKHLR